MRSKRVPVANYREAAARRTRGTDARQILRQVGFNPPWRNNLLVAASRVFQCKELPADQDPDRPVTLHLQKKPEVVGYDEKADRAESLELTDSRLKGPKLQVSLNRGYWLRALESGFRRFGFRGPGEPVAAYYGQRQYVWSVLEGVSQPTATIRSAPGNRPVSENAEDHDLSDSEEPTPVDEAGEIQFRLRQTINEAQQVLKRLDRQQQPRRGRQRVGI